MANDSAANIVWHPTTVTKEQRQQRAGHKSAVLWFTGLSGAGKSTLANAVEHELGHQVFVVAQPGVQQLAAGPGAAAFHKAHVALRYAHAQRQLQLAPAAHMARGFEGVREVHGTRVRPRTCLRQLPGR